MYEIFPFRTLIHPVSIFNKCAIRILIKSIKIRSVKTAFISIEKYIFFRVIIQTCPLIKCVINTLPVD